MKRTSVVLAVVLFTTSISCGEERGRDASVARDAGARDAGDQRKDAGAIGRDAGSVSDAGGRDGGEEDRTPPVIVSSTPSSGSMLASGRVVVVVDFSEPMDTGVTSVVVNQMTQTGGNVGFADLSWSTSSTSAQASFDARSDATITIVLDDLRDVAGNALAAPTSLTYTSN